MNRICIGIACSAAMVTAAGALAQQAGQSSTRSQSHPQTQAAPQNHAKGVVNVQKSTDTSGAQQLLQRLAGEWEGQVQVRGTDGFNSASVISASNKLEDNAPIDELRAQGLGIDEAIAELLRRRGHQV